MEVDIVFEPMTKETKFYYELCLDLSLLRKLYNQTDDTELKKDIQLRIIKLKTLLKQD